MDGFNPLEGSEGVIITLQIWFCIPLCKRMRKEQNCNKPSQIRWRKMGDGGISWGGENGKWKLHIDDKNSEESNKIQEGKSRKREKKEIRGKRKEKNSSCDL